MQFSVRGVVTTGQDALDFAISDLEIVQSGTSAVVLATSGANGGLTSYSLVENGTASVVDWSLYNPSWALGLSNDLAIIEDGGTLRAVVGATSSTKLGTYSVSLGGAIGSFSGWGGLAPTDTRPTALTVLGTDTLIVSNPVSGFSTYDRSPQNALSLQDNVTDNALTLLTDVSAFATLDVSGTDILVAASAGEHGVTSYRMTASGPLLADWNGPDQGLGIMTPTALDTAEVDGIDYVIIASAQDSAGALSVLSVDSAGALTATDHVLDTLDTRFGATQDVRVILSGDRAYVVAGGGDDGISLFVLLPDGKLQILASLEDTLSTGLQNVATITGAALGNTLRLLVASQEAGLTDLAVDISNQGIVRMAAIAGQSMSGDGHDDILVGYDGNDQINGGGGDDILVDGAGRDDLTGGAGRDIFVLRDDADEDTITDFNPALDRLDLSSWPMFHDPVSLTITSTGVGAKIIWRNETLVLLSSTGSALNVEEVRAAVLRGTNRPRDLSGITFPNDQTHDLTGTTGDDTLRGSGGDETIAPGAGNDMVWAGAGDDTILGGSGVDCVYLLDGQDVFRDLSESLGTDGDEVFGGSGNDIIFTGDGMDTIDGGTEADTIRSGRGNDTVVGGSGDDVIYGGSGWDRIEAGDGDDRLYGGAHRDRLFGDDGNDYLNGGPGDDMLYGRTGNDVLIGDSGNDILRGEEGDDTLKGGDGDDVLAGSLGNDFIWGDDGNDTLNGDDDDDTLYGGRGMDVLNGGDGADYLDGGVAGDRIRGNGGDDTLIGGHGYDRLSGGDGNDVMYGGAHNDLLWGGNGRDALYGESGNDRIFGQADDDVIFGGSGNDMLYGGSGADAFMFLTATSGQDWIRDFDPAVDLITLFGANTADLTLTESGSNLVLSWDNGSITLSALDLSDFSVSDIIFG